MDSQKAGRPITFIVISSVSRENYTREADLSSGKGSGGLEFTADVVLGMQPRIMVTPSYRRAKEQTKRSMVKTAKNPGPGEPRLIMIECTTNRFGASDYSVGFKYYPAKETFIPDDDFDAWLSEVRLQEAKIALAAEQKAAAEEKKLFEECKVVDKDGWVNVEETAKNIAGAVMERFFGENYKLI